MILRGLAILLCLQLAGEVLSRLLALPLPGPVIGLALLLCVLIVRPSLIGHVEGGSDALLAHLSLLFIPAGVGVLVHIDRLDGALVGVALTLGISTLLGMTVTALTLQRLMRGRTTRDTPRAEPDE